MKNISFLPTIETQGELEALIGRIGWYLYPYRHQIASIRLPLAFALPPTISVPPMFDSTATTRFMELLPRCEPIHIDKESGSSRERELAATSDLVLVWKWPKADTQREILKESLRGLRAGGKWYDVDPATSRAEGSYYLWLGPQCFPDGGASIEKSKEVLRTFARSVAHKKAYVFGTGPSLSALEDPDFSDGDAYVANSIVKNRALLNKIRPRALVAADPIFHTGCSAYAAEFRRQLIEVLDEYGVYFFVPVRDYYIYTSFLPQRHIERLACIPFDDKAPYNSDLLESFYVNGTSNVLTLFLLPLAATFHSTIAILGCDGRPRSENGYFWSHDPASQFGDFMRSAMDTHPAFFAIDYNDYYDEHIKVLSDAVESIERKGRQVISLTPSHIPVLANRLVSNNSQPPVEIVGLAPDASTEAGHYIGYEEHLRTAFGQASINYLTLCNRTASAEILAQHPTFHPALEIHTWDIGNNWTEPPASRLAQYCEELAAGLDTLTDLYGKAKRVIYLYYGSLYHAEATVRLLRARPWVYATINLFWTCNDQIWTDDFGIRWRSFSKMLAENPQLNVTVSTVELQRELAQRIGIMLPLAPHPSPTFSDQAYLSLRTRLPLRRKGKFGVVFPGMLRRDKGYHLTVSAVSALLADETVECHLRVVAANDAPEELSRMAGALDRKAKVVHGELSRDGFVEFLLQGDVAVIPYSVQAFARRTSGILVDAFYCGMPVVAIRGSWLGNRIEETGAGIVVADEDHEGIVEAVNKIRADFLKYREKALQAGAQWYQSNSWSALAASILSGFKANV